MYLKKKLHWKFGEKWRKMRKEKGYFGKKGIG